MRIFSTPEHSFLLEFAYFTAKIRWYPSDRFHINLLEMFLMHFPSRGMDICPALYNLVKTEELHISIHGTQRWLAHRPVLLVVCLS